MAAPLTIRQCLAYAEKINHCSDSPRLDVELLLSHVLHKNRAYLYGFSQNYLDETERHAFQQLFDRRSRGEPLAYLIGNWGFWSLELKVNETTLIPRPETELLVELALDHCFEQAHILDLGTGTGAVALSLAKELPQSTVHAVDVSSSVIELANENKKNNQTSNVSVYQSDWFDGVNHIFDVIVGNPPYIEENDPHLNQGDLRFEPKTALVSGQDGLVAMTQICKEAPAYLHEGGWLLLEHGWKQGDAVRHLFAKNGLHNIETRSDYSGNDRVTLGQFSEIKY